MRLIHNNLYLYVLYHLLALPILPIHICLFLFCPDPLDRSRALMDQPQCNGLTTNHIPEVIIKQPCISILILSREAEGLKDISTIPIWINVLGVDIHNSPQLNSGIDPSFFYFD